MRGIGGGLLAAVVVLGASASAFAQPVNVVVKLQERVPLQELAAAVTDPTSPRYQKFYTNDELRALVAPSDADYAATLAALKARGLEIVAESPTHLWISAKAEHTVLEKAFQTKFKFSKKGRSALLAPRIPGELSLVESVTGFDNTRKAKPRIKFGDGLDGKSGQPGVLPAQIKTAYGYDAVYAAGWTGKGEHIAIATYDGFYLTDIQQYYTLIGLKTAPTVDQVTFNGTPTLNDGSAAETQLDAEFSGMMAPGAQIHIFASAENSDAGEEAMFTAILDDGRAKVANYSWGTCETYVADDHRAAMDKIFARAVAQGVNILVASGDSGTDGCGDGTTVADWPAERPDVVSVGGTSLTLNSDNSIQSEEGWSNGGGGYSGFYPAPSWEVGSLSAPNNTQRGYPDVAFNADNVVSGQAIWTHYGSSNGKPRWLTVGGTSMAAPQWAGLLTLINEARVAAKKTELGQLDPILFGASKAVNATILSDITTGNNGDTAGPGWDAATGLGSPKAGALLTFLVAQ